jgi:putative SOS response-associated peptidase YedK
MCNLYNMTSSQRAILDLARALVDKTGNRPILPGIYPNTDAPIVREGSEGRELVMAHWGMPSPAFTLEGKTVDKGITNIRNTKSPHWRRWLGQSSRCLVPFTAFSEPGRDENNRFKPI